jgi:N-acetylglucosamine kinase-like BadF-type ATPase
VETKKDEVRLFPFSLFCASDVAINMHHIRSAVLDMCGKNVAFDQVHVYISVLGYEHVDGRKRMLNYGEAEFGGFIMEPDWKTLHNSIFGKKNGVLITINDGYIVSYSTDQSQTIHKLQGYSFPISDEAGNIWLGSEALKHAINVKEGLEKRTLLSDKILSMVNSDIDLLATKTFEKPRETYLEVSTIVKELALREKKSHELIQQAFDNIWLRVSFIDKEIGQELPIALAGDLAYLYEEFIPKGRLVKTDLINETESFNYAKNLLQAKAKQNG